MDVEPDHGEGPSGHLLEEIKEQHRGVPEGQDGARTSVSG